jgi:hypothetical protein
MRQARERVRFALDDPEGDITALPDQLLLEAVALAYRKDMPGALFFGVGRCSSGSMRAPPATTPISCASSWCRKATQ